MNIPSISVRIFSALLKLYPKPFRNEFEEEMQTVFAAWVKDHTKDGLIPLMTSCLFEYLDLLYNLFYEYWVAFQKAYQMDKFLYGKFHNRLILWGGFVFGLANGLELLFGSLTGLNAVHITDYTLPTLLASYLIQLLFFCAATGIFWLSTPRFGKKWRFLVPVAGAGVISIVNFLVGVAVIINPQRSRYLLEWIWTIHYPEFYMLIWSLVFGGLFGWAYRGWKAIAPFALVTVLSKFLRYIIGWIMAVIFNININPTENIWLNPQSYFWPLAWIIIGGLIFGALLGWAVKKVNQMEDLAAV